jgi:hypothetical protein
MDADEQEFVDYEGDDDYEQQMDDAEVADLVEEEGVDYEDEGDVADEEVDEEQPIKTEDDHNYGDEELQGLAEGESDFRSWPKAVLQANQLPSHSLLCVVCR